jgi:hypothetical protein
VPHGENAHFMLTWNVVDVAARSCQQNAARAWQGRKPIQPANLRSGGKHPECVGEFIEKEIRRGAAILSHYASSVRICASASGVVVTGRLTDAGPALTADIWRRHGAARETLEKALRSRGSASTRAERRGSELAEHTTKNSCCPDQRWV